MKKNLVKAISIFLLILIITGIAVNTISQAASYDSVDVDFVTKNASDDTGAADSALSIVQSLSVIFRVAGIGIAVIMLIVIAIKYMMSAPSDRADIKKSAIAYIVGAVVLFAASGILGIIGNFAKNVKPASGS